MGIKIGNIDISKIYIASGATPRLPSAYQEVEYIQSSGTQYINTLFTPNQNSKVQFKISGWNQSGSYDMFGADYGWGNSGFSILPTAYCFGGVLFEGNNVFADGNLHTGELSKDGLYRDGILMNVPTATTFTSRILFLFALNRGSAQEKSSYNLFYFKIYDGITLERDFVPCYRISDSVIGMYDLVNDVFYTNNGSGTFTKGGDVNLPYKEIRKVYKGSTQVRPTANGLSYNFTTKTTSDLANDGWTVGTGVTTDSGGFYSGALWYPISQIGTVDATKKITITQEFMTGTIGSWRSTALLGLGENNNSTADANIGAVYMGLMTNRNYKLRWILYQIGDGVASNDFSWTSNTEYSATYIIDLANKEVSIEINLKSDGSTVVTTTKSLSDAEVTKFVGSSYLLTTGGGAGERIHNISVAIE